ncbi:BatA domain-containing protein [Aporhodopirellula aestuarii]|uniref:BatA domain-containing protein n=1 Tax=Aporhodopirellula aestuarii TaxID=2950107 RepID=A0ABT0U7I3_9BACT|nr:BatA domain-containing protein [Aporhodopirellula aestuarii]MCM2372767.1 BatA domain-containing protein [Aporhodopirellula aestuarii]
MNFIHVGFVMAGAAAMTLPLWIHLLLRQRARPMDIGSIRFLQHVVKRTQSRQRIQRWLLLALRSLAVLLLGFLFARPYFPDTPADGRTREVAILIDRSASMSAKHKDGRSAIEVARQRADQFIGTLGEQASVHIGLFDSSGVEVIPLAELKNLKSAATGTRFDEAFSWATDLLAASDRADRSLLVLSDLQRSGVRHADLSTFPADIEVRIVDPAPAITQNLAIELAVPTQVEIRPGIPISISVRVHNGGEFPVTNVSVVATISGPSKKFSAKHVLALAAGERQTIPMELLIDEPGVYQGSVSIDREDLLPWDNRRYIALQAKYPDRVLLVDGDAGRTSWENATYFVETALRLRTAVGEGPARTFEVERLVWDQGSGFPDLDGFRLIVIANVGRFTARDADRLRAFMQAGGNVLWFAGERTTDAVLDPVLQAGLIGSTKISSATDTIASVMRFDEKHPALDIFADTQYGDLRGLRVRRLMPVKSLDTDTKVLMESRRYPLILSHTTGNAHFVLVLTSADRSWSDWPQNRLFVPLVRQLAAWLTGQLDSVQPVSFEVINSAMAAPGIEQLGESVVVRNMDPAESEIARLGEQEFREAIRLPEEAILSEETEMEQQFSPAGVARSDEKWPILIWILLGVLGTELLLASRVHE